MPVKPGESTAETPEDIYGGRALADIGLEELVEIVRKQREDLGLMPPASDSDSVDEHTEKRSLKGGAFGGALKRRIAQTDSAEKRAATNENDIKLLGSSIIAHELFGAQGDQAYGGILFTPGEFKHITFSPKRAAQTIGATVLEGTAGRSPDDRFSRKQEVLEGDLVRRSERAQGQLTKLHQERDLLTILSKEMRSPGYAHMTMDEMDGLMKGVEGIFVSMLDAIVTNHLESITKQDQDAAAARVDSLANALDYLLSTDDYKPAFTYWKQMTVVATNWTHAKINRFEEVQYKIQEEIATRTT